MQIGFRKLVDAGVLLAIGIVIGLMTADISSAEHFASEWQTLIAGVLAVIAAAWTVNEMRRTDRNQQNRHDQLIGQGDIERTRQLSALTYYAQIIEGNAEVYAEAFTRLASATSTDVKRKALIDIFTANDLLIGNVLNADFVDRRRFFTGQLSMAYSATEKFARTIKRLRDDIHDGKIKATDEWIEANTPKVMRLDEQLRLTLFVLAEELKKAGEPN